MNVFISYVRAGKDRKIARKLYKDLKDFGASPWLDEKKLFGGRNWKEQITDKIKESSYFLTLLSSNSVKSESYFKEELKIAFDVLNKSIGPGIFIIPVRLNNCKPADADKRLKSIHYIDLFPSYVKGLFDILRTFEFQIYGETTISYPREEYFNLKIQKLKQLCPCEKLTMTWDTFINGLHRLKEMINNVPAVKPQIIFGINESGIIAATYLSHHLKTESRIGIIKTGSKDKKKKFREIIQFDFPNHEVKQFDGTTKNYPNIKNPTTIAIVDNEIKSGGSALSIMNMLRDRYGKDINIYYFVLVGVIAKTDSRKEINDIHFFGWDIKDNEDKPDFMAYYIEVPGARGPEGMR